MLEEILFSCLVTIFPYIQNESISSDNQIILFKFTIIFEKYLIIISKINTIIFIG